MEQLIAIMDYLGILLQPFHFTFMQQAFSVVILIAVPCALISCFLVLKGWSLMGDAIAHSILPGVVIAYIFAIPYIIGAFIAGIACSLGTGFIKDHSRLKEDTVMGIVFSAMFALGLVLMSKIESDVHLDHILFGDLLGISWTEVIESGYIAIIVISFILVKGKDLLVYVFDHQHAKAIGLSTRFLHYALLALLSFTIVASLKLVGMILVISLLIAPGAIAFLLTKHFSTMLFISVIVASFSALVGVYLSFFIDSAPAPTIIMVMTFIFVVTFIFKQTSTQMNTKMMATIETEVTRSN